MGHVSYNISSNRLVSYYDIKYNLYLEKYRENILNYINQLILVIEWVVVLLPKKKG